MSSQETVVPLSVPLALFFYCLTLYMGILVIEHGVPLLHCDKDFLEIAGIRPLASLWFETGGG